jgi:Undecaprenyl-phosphate glucose phosphotransferase
MLETDDNSMNNIKLLHKPLSITALELSGPSASSVVELRGERRSHEAEHEITIAKHETNKFREIISFKAFPVLLLSIEFLILSSSLYISAEMYHNSRFVHFPNQMFYMATSVTAAAALTMLCAYNRDYSIRKITFLNYQLKSAVLHWNTVFLTLMIALFIVQATDFYSRAVILYQYAVGIASCIALRMLGGYLASIGLKRRLFAGRRAMILGEASSVHSVARRLASSDSGLSVVCTAILPSTCEQHPSISTRTNGAPDAGQIVNAIRSHNIDEVIVTAAYRSPWLKTLVEDLAVSPATVHLVPDVSASWVHELTPARLGRLTTLKILHAPLSLRDQLAKRSMDIILSTLFIVLALPIFLIIALAIKLDSRGPVLFRQRRNGFNQDEFKILKFRTMMTLEDGLPFRQATRNDGRITRVGAFLRRTNLDELPQLLNVLLGHMSLVGPRPHAIAHNGAFEKKIQLYAKRHNVKPGITGWSQINGYRGETETLAKMEKRVEYDIYYIDHWSVFFDLYIIIKTVFSKKSYSNAY